MMIKNRSSKLIFNRFIFDIEIIKNQAKFKYSIKYIIKLKGLKQTDQEIAKLFQNSLNRPDL